MKLIRILAVAGVLAAGACSGSATPAATPGAVAGSASPAAPPAAPAAVAGARLGAAGSACRLPFTFDATAEWKPKAVDVKEFGDLAELAKVGEFDTVCEIDAKPAGHIGFLRVYLAEGLSGQPREHLKPFVEFSKREISNVTYQDIQVASQQGAEVTWDLKDTEFDLTTRYSAFAMNTKAGAVVVQLSPFDESEHEAMLPAFRLAQTSAAVAS